MANSDLIFTHAPTGSDLVFGAQEAITQGSTITARIKAVSRVHVVVAPKVLATAMVKVPATRMHAVMDYDINVNRPVTCQIDASVSKAAAISAQLSSGWADAANRRAALSSRWADGSRASARHTAAWSDASRLRNVSGFNWQDGKGINARPAAILWQDGKRSRVAASEKWQNGKHSCRQATAAFQDGERRRHGIDTDWQNGQRTRAQISQTVQSAKPMPLVVTIVWQCGHVPRPGKWVPADTGGGTTPRTPDANLVFERPAGTAGNLVFNWSSDAIVVAARKVYIVINDVSLMRVDTSTYLDVLSLEISIDSGSWVHSWNATVAWSDWDVLNSGYVTNEVVELLATVNGHQWRLLAEGTPKRTRVFGQTGVSISGRGYAAWLDTPYADEVSHYNDSALTAQQLMASALTTNGVSIGWDLDWQITDWTVPAGLWSHTGSPIAGVLDVATSVQAIIQADPTEQILHVLPYYPASPWEWNTLDPDVVLPLDIIPEEDLEPVIKPVYNRVYVSGSSQGVIGQVTRTGTAGDKLAQMVTHPLITAEAAARQRGIAILGDSGHQAIITRQMPISTDTGLIKVGQLIKATETAETWRGLVRSVKVSANWTNDALVVRQAFDLERHYEL